MKDEGAGFLKGGGQLGELIAAFDWSKTSLGPIAAWPAAMRAQLGMMLRSPMPIVTLWGEPGVMIYNDGYSVFAGKRHPQLLGMDVRQAWPEVADFNDNIVKTVFRQGKTLSYTAQELQLDRRGGLESAWLDLDYSPMIDEDGKPLGVIAIVVEITDKVLADRKLTDERTRLEQMYAQAPNFMALLEGPEHRFMMANPAYGRVVGDRAVLGKTVAEALPEAAEQGYVALLDKVYASGEALVLTAACALLMAACATTPKAANPQDIFLAQLNALCGQRFEGRVVTTDAADADFASSRLVMHVRDCAPDE
ncbi:MAG: PAS domain-containing sensor histidine kinase, partial [Sphingomonadales bacterium]